MAKRPHPRESARALRFEQMESRHTLTAGVVDVSAAGGVLTITGDANNDRLTVTRDHAGDYVIRAGGNTVLTAGAGVTLDHRRIIVPAADNVTSINVDLGEGNNSLNWVRTTLPDSLSITGGDGNNFLMMTGIRGDSDVSATLGGGLNRVVLSNDKIGNLSLAVGTASSTNTELVGVGDSWITGTTHVTTGAGQDRVWLGSINENYGDQFDGDVFVSMGDANDEITVDGSVFQSNLSIDGGTGFNGGFGSATLDGNYTFTGMPYNEITLNGLYYYQYVPPT